MPDQAGDELADVLISRYKKSSTIISSNRPFDDCAKLLGDVVILAALLDRIMDYGHLLKFEGQSWRLKEAAATLAKNSQESRINLFCHWPVLTWSPGQSLAR
jgi:DNA replication protein DnaC